MSTLRYILMSATDIMARRYSNNSHLHYAAFSQVSTYNSVCTITMQTVLDVKEYRN